MTLAGPAPVNGGLTPIPFDSARPPDDAPAIDECASALPASPDAIREMQAQGRSWLHSERRQQGTNVPSGTPGPAEPTPPALIAKSPLSPNGKSFVPAKPPRKQTHAASCASPSPPDQLLQSLMGACDEVAKIIDDRGNALPQYKGALLAVSSLVDAIREQQQNPCDGPALHADAEGCVLICDFDETSHGLFAAIKQIKNACANGLDSLGDALAQEANLWAHDPKAWLTQSAMPHGGGDVAITCFTGAVLLPFALLALHAGFSEMREAKMRGEELKLEVAYSFEFLKTLERLSQSLKTNTPPQFRRLVEAYQKVCAQQLDDLARLQKKTKQNAQIGFCSAGSGAAITGSAALGALGKTVAVPALATTIGAAGTLAVAPAAALFAVGLGANMVATSTEARKHFKAAAEPLKKRLEDTSLAVLRRQTAGKHDYLAFLTKKLEQRAHFFKDYVQKNRRFLFGTSLYTASAVASCGFTAAALLGAGVALGPIGMGALIVAGTVGGLIMGRYSTQFLFGHGRMHRYENSSRDHPQLNRKLQNILDSIETLSGGAMGIEADTGITLRADIYKQASNREELRQDFLTEVADKTQTRYHQMYSYSTDSEEVRAKRGGAPTAWSIARATIRKKTDTLIGYLHAGRRYLGTLLRSRSHAAAKADANKLRQDIKPYLSSGKLQDWLHKEKNHSRQIAFMLDSLTPQIESLKKIAKLQTDLFSFCNNLDALQRMEPCHAAPFEIAGDAMAHRAFLKDLVAPLARNADLLGQMEHLKIELTEYMQSSEAPPQPLLAKTIMQFLSLQEGKSCNAATPLPDFGESQKAFADYTINGAAGSYRHLRSMLIDVELQAIRLARKETPQPVNPRAGA